MISALIPYLFLHLLSEQRTLDNLPFMLDPPLPLPLSYTLLPLVTYSLFSFHLFLAWLMCTFSLLEQEQNVTENWNEKQKAESCAALQREHGNKGTLWSSRLTLLSALIRGLDQSEPPGEVFPGLTSPASPTSWPMGSLGVSMATATWL